MKYITLEQIEQHNPCASEFRKVKRFFGKRKRIVVTVRRAVAVADQFNFDWLAEKLLSAPARRPYADAAVPARRAYAEAMAPAYKAYDDAMAAAYKAYDDAMAAAWKAYADATAATFARAYLKQ